MASVVSASAGHVTRTWRLSSGSPIQLRHNTVLGDWQLSVDAIEVSEGRATLLGFKALIPLVAPHKGYVVVEPRVMAAAFGYTCWYGDPAQQLVEENAAPSTASTSASPYAAAVTGYDLVSEDAGVSIAMWRVSVKRQSDGVSTVVHRRHREFYAMGETVLSSYKGSALETSHPPLPSRTVPFMQDPLHPAFLEQRRAELHNQLVKLEAVPRMRSNGDFHAFLGLVEGTRESSVVFGHGAAMGLSLKNAGAYTEVEAVKEGPAAASGLVAVGSRLSKVQGEDVLGMPYDVVIARLKACPRPMVVHFLTDVGGAGGGTPSTQLMDAFVGAVAGPSSVTALPPVAEAAGAASELVDQVI